MIPGSRRPPAEAEWQPTLVFLPREFHRQRSLAGYSSWGCKESDTTDQLTLSHTLTHSILPITLRSCPVDIPSALQMTKLRLRGKLRTLPRVAQLANIQDTVPGPPDSIQGRCSHLFSAAWTSRPKMPSWHTQWSMQSPGLLTGQHGPTSSSTREVMFKLNCDSGAGVRV